MSQPQGALVVGSVNYDAAETTIRTAAEILGPRLERIHFPDDVEVGFHLCHGDVGAGSTSCSPTDTANLVRFANGVFAAVDRTVTWLHLPVPIDRCGIGRAPAGSSEDILRTHTGIPSAW